MEGAGVGQFRGLIAAAIGVVAFGVLLAWVALRYQNNIFPRGHRFQQRLAKSGTTTSTFGIDLGPPLLCSAPPLL